MAELEQVNIKELEAKAEELLRKLSIEDIKKAAKQNGIEVNAEPLLVEKYVKASDIRKTVYAAVRLHLPYYIVEVRYYFLNYGYTDGKVETHAFIEPALHCDCSCGE